MKKTQKLLALFLTLSLVLSMLVCTTFFAAAATVTNTREAVCKVAASEQNAGTDDHYVKADVTFESTSEFTAGIFTVEAEGMGLDSCTVAECVGGTAPNVYVSPEKNKVIFAGFSESTEYDFRSFTKLTLTLKLTVGEAGLGDTPTVSIKNISITNVDEEKYTTADASATVEITSVTHIPGDINDDGSVNNKDLTRLFQYLSDWDVTVNADALDVNGDGSVNNKDLTRLFQYLSDWDVQIF